MPLIYFLQKTRSLTLLLYFPLAHRHRVNQSKNICQVNPLIALEFNAAIFADQNETECIVGYGKVVSYRIGFLSI